MSESPMLLIGLMSGTSLDGVDAALVRIRGPLSVELLGFAHRAYLPEERAAIEAVLAGAGIAETARLHAALAEWAAEAVENVLALTHTRADALAAIAFPGQTMWHEPPRVSYQVGEPAILAERFGVRVVGGFRARDVAAGGQGAPLVPMADALCFGATDHPRLLLNLGGMANVTWVRRRGEMEGVVGADTGPGMAIIDEMARLVDASLPYDVDGRLAANGLVDEGVLAELLDDPFFRLAPPRSTGREHFGQEYARALSRRLPGPDGVRTAVALTVESVVRCCEAHFPEAADLVVAGGGTRHPVLMSMLAERCEERGMPVRTFDECFFAAEAKEAAFQHSGIRSLEFT